MGAHTAPTSQVSTYQGMWGGVSGGVEPSDTSLVDRAYEEVRPRTAWSAKPRQVSEGIGP